MEIEQLSKAFWRISFWAIRCHILKDGHFDGLCNSKVIETQDIRNMCNQFQEPYNNKKDKQIDNRYFKNAHGILNIHLCSAFMLIYTQFISLK
jgi:hypothetical protein